MKDDDAEYEEEFGKEPLDKDQPADDGLTSEIENRLPVQLDEKEVKVAGVYEYQEQGVTSPMHEKYFVLLRDNQDRVKEIWIGRFEAYAIEVALEGAEFDRPMTHDLLKRILDRLGGKVEQVLIDDLRENTYYAKITITTDGKTLDIDARPSDAIALALRARAPIYMAEAVIAADSEQDNI